MPCRSSRANWRTLLQVHRRGDSGSPRVVGSTNRSRSARKAGSLSVVFFRPPPGRRIRSLPSWASGVCRSSSSPWRIARRDTPVHRETREMPRDPKTWASAAATKRRNRSSRCGSSSSKRCAMLGSPSAIPQREYHSSFRKWYSYFLTIPNGGRPIARLPLQNLPHTIGKLGNGLHRPSGSPRVRRRQGPGNAKNLHPGLPPAAALGTFRAFGCAGMEPGLSPPRRIQRRSSGKR